MAEPVEDRGTYMDVRVKQKDGSWKFQWDTFHSSLPIPGME